MNSLKGVNTNGRSFGGDDSRNSSALAFSRASLKFAGILTQGVSGNTGNWQCKYRAIDGTSSRFAAPLSNALTASTIGRYDLANS